MLTRILTTAVIAGILAGVATTALQVVWSVPVIIEAEMYEFGILNPDGSLAPGAMPDYVAAHQDLWQRHIKTFLANVLNGVGLGMLMMAVFAFRPISGWRQGLLWGLAGFAVFHVAPSLGLPPKLPGTQTAPLEDRQIWWLATVVASGVGLGLIAFSKAWALRIAAVGLLVLPHLMGAPQPDDQAFASPVALQREFFAASLGTAAMLWAVLGTAVGYLSGRAATGADEQSLSPSSNV